MGAGVELLAQYRYQHSARNIATALGTKTDQQILAGLSFGFDYTWNEHVGERDSILNIEHNAMHYGPQNAAH